MDQKFHYIYKTTCDITGKFYIGMHSTPVMEDRYLGSGKHLVRSIKKHGRKNHSREILEFLPSRDKLKEREIEIVNEDLLQDPLCMNLIKGGEGGGGLHNEDHAKKFHAAGGKAVFKMLGQRHNEKLKTDPDYKKQYSETISKVRQGEKNGFHGKKHSEETKAKMRAAHQKRNLSPSS